jgi:hypothetical protein
VAATITARSGAIMAIRFHMADLEASSFHEGWISGRFRAPRGTDHLAGTPCEVCEAFS